MSRIDTWMPLYVGDYLADTMHLNTAQHGAYLLLLMHQWRTGPLPDDDAQLASIARCDLGTWRRAIAPVVRKFFTPTPDGLSQKRLAAERILAADITDKRAEAGRAGAARRWQNGSKSKATAPENGSGGNGTDIPDATSKPNGNAMANAMANACEGHWQNDGPSHLQQQRKEEDRSLRSLPRRQAVEADFEAFWKAYPRKVAKLAASKAFRAATRKASVVEIADGLNRQVWPDDPQFIPHPATWLNEGRWGDEPTAQTPRAPLQNARKTADDAYMARVLAGHDEPENPMLRLQ